MLSPSEDDLERIDEHLLQSETLFHQKDWRRALEVLQPDFDLVKNNPSWPSNIYYSLAINLADIHLGLENFAIAERTANECLAKFGTDTPEFVVKTCKNILANVYARTERFDEAETAVKDIISRVAQEGGEFDTSLGPEYHLLVVIYSATERLVEAEGALRALEQIHQNVDREGHPDRRAIADALASAANVLTRANAAPLPSATSELPLPASSAGPERLMRAEGNCWRCFCNHDFAVAASLADGVLALRPNVRMIEVSLLSQMWSGNDVRHAGEKALALAPADVPGRAIIEFTLGRLPFESALALMERDEDKCQIWFYAGMIALLKGKESEARDRFARVVEFAIDLPERHQAGLELEGLDYAACDIDSFDVAIQREIQAAYNDFADYDWVGFSQKASKLTTRGPATPQLLLMQIAGLQALAARDLVFSLVALARRQLLRWPWHLRMIDVVTERIPMQALLPLAQGAVEVCQLQYYACVSNRLSGHWEEAKFHRDEALRTGAVCAERALAELDQTNLLAKLDNINGYVNVMADRGELAIAESAGRGGLWIVREHPELDGSVVARTIGNLAAMLGTSGRPSESLQLFEEIRSSPRFAKMDQFPLSLNLGQLYLENGVLPEAGEWLERAWNISQTTTRSGYERGALCNALGQLAQANGDIAGAADWYAAAAKQLEADPDSDRFLRGVIADNTGINLALSQKYQEALVQHEKARQLLGGLAPSHPSVIKVMENTAWVLGAIGRREDAQKLLLDGLARCGFPGSDRHPLTAHLLVMLAMSHCSSGESQQALDLLIAASRIEDSHFGEAMSLSSDELRLSYAVRALFELSMLLTTARDQPAGSERLEKVFDIVLRRKALVAQTTAARRDVVLGGRYPSLRPLLEELHRLQNQIATAELAVGSNKQAPTDERDIAGKRERIRLLETSLAKQIPELRIDRALRDVSVRRVLEDLRANWNVIELVRARIRDFTAVSIPDDYFGPEHYLAFVIPAGKIEQLRLVDLGPAAALDEAVRDFLRTLGDYGIEPAVSCANVVREKLVRPLFSLLPSAGHVVLAPDGYLARLPFEVLPGLDCELLVDRYSFGYVTTIRDVLRSSIASSAPRNRDVVVADPAFGEYRADSQCPVAGGFEPLSGTRGEATAVAEVLGVDPWLGADASKERLMRLISPRILHIATHGFLTEPHGAAAAYRRRVIAVERIPLQLNMDDTLLRSGLALAGANTARSSEADDGLLTASDVSAMNLLGTQLVVLSACDTARGAGHPTEGPIGIRRAFYLAGARTVIASQWKLPDEQTCAVMRGFYQRVCRGTSCSEALRAAQLEVRQSLPSPFFWGAFVCFGDTGPISGMELMSGSSEQANRQEAKEEEDAIKRWSLALQRAPFDAEALLWRGISFHNLGRYAEALADFDRALELSPNLPVIWFSRGLTYHVFGRPEKAIADFNRALELDPAYGKAYHRRGLSFQRLGDDQAARRDLDKAVELLPEDPELRYDRGGYFADREMLTEAREEYSEAIRFRPTYQVAYVNRGSVLIQLRAFKDAVADLRTAVQLDPGDALAYLNLGSALAMNGDAAEALECWEVAARSGKAETVLAAQQMIAQLSAILGDHGQLSPDVKINVSASSPDQL